ncbi:MAG: hypothetical protein GY913_35720 [Proteobacteria bacterium]|nr:hypothetical protein [Pseudomonadota bacterium]MCP4922281.1 hypothetical protein [Pseudomonadota bacterium]
MKSVDSSGSSWMTPQCSPLFAGIQAFGYHSVIEPRGNSTVTSTCIAWSVWK